MLVTGLEGMLVGNMEDKRDKGVKKHKFKLIKWSEAELFFVSRVSMEQQIARELLEIDDILEIF